HLLLSADTRGYLGRDRLALMKPTAFLVNTARGAIVDKAALIDALREKRIAGAALDVFHEEPIPQGDPILSLPNVVLTPHNGGQTPELLDALLLQAVETVEHLVARPASIAGQYVPPTPASIDTTTTTPPSRGTTGGPAPTIPTIPTMRRCRRSSPASRPWSRP